MTENSGGRQGVVVVGYDGSESSLGALEWAATYAQAFSLRVRGIRAWRPPVTYDYDLRPTETMDLEGVAQAQLTAAMDGMRKRYPSVVFEEVVANDSPAAALIDASNGAELLVVGSRGHGGFTGMLLGSVSAHCVHHAKCTVVVVH